MGNETDQQQGWMSDVQRAIALILIVTFAAVVVATIVKVVIWGDSDAVLDLAKTLQAALVNMSLIALGFFFGNTVAQRVANEGQQKILERLTPTPATPAPTATIPAWWSELSDAEKNAITAAGDVDLRAHAIVLALTAGSATADDLTYLVSKGLLTQARVDEISAA